MEDIKGKNHIIQEKCMENEKKKEKEKLDGIRYVFIRRIRTSVVRYVCYIIFKQCAVLKYNTNFTVFIISNFVLLNVSHG